MTSRFQHTQYCICRVKICLYNLRNRQTFGDFLQKPFLSHRTSTRRQGQMKRKISASSSSVCWCSWILRLSPSDHCHYVHANTEHCYLFRNFRHTHTHTQLSWKQHKIGVGSLIASFTKECFVFAHILQRRTLEVLYHGGAIDHSRPPAAPKERTKRRRHSQNPSVIALSPQMALKMISTFTRWI